jgi:hypothetical protein
MVELHQGETLTLGGGEGCGVAVYPNAASLTPVGGGYAPPKLWP